MLRVLASMFKPVLQEIRLLTGLNMGGKTRNIAIQLVLQQCCKTSCTFFVARFSVPLIRFYLLTFIAFPTLCFHHWSQDGS